MPARKVECAECGAALPDSFADAGGKQPCAACGAEKIAVFLWASDSARLEDHATWTARTSNAAPARRRQLERAVAELDAAVGSNNVSAAQEALKQALEALHELADCLNRGEWSQQGWTADEIGVWYAHIGARNAAHHTSTSLVALHSHGSPGQRLVWEEPVSVRSARQTTEYQTRLLGLPVRPALETLFRRVSSSVG